MVEQVLIYSSSLLALTYLLFRQAPGLYRSTAIVKKTKKKTIGRNGRIMDPVARSEAQRKAKEVATDAFAGPSLSHLPIPAATTLPAPAPVASKPAPIATVSNLVIMPMSSQSRPVSISDSAAPVSGRAPQAATPANCSLIPQIAVLVAAEETEIPVASTSVSL